MKPALARLLVSCYPRSWKGRYGEEFEALLQDRSGNLQTVGNVIWSALCERVFPTTVRLEHYPRLSRFESLCVRAPWAMFSLAPLFFLMGAYFMACFVLWSGWRLFLPDSITPFVPIGGFAIFYFDAGRFVYYAAPLLIGWAVVVLADRRRFTLWPSVGLVLIALVGGTAQVYASRSMVHGSGPHVGLHFSLGTTVLGLPSSLLHGSIILSFTMLPYLMSRSEKICPAAE